LGSSHDVNDDDDDKPQQPRPPEKRAHIGLFFPPPSSEAHDRVYGLAMQEQKFLTPKNLGSAQA
jgi:hypothetical protein